MDISLIAFEPNSEYIADGKRSTGLGVGITNFAIRLKVDQHGRLIAFNDGYSSDLSMADSWDYLKIKNEKTGRVIDLRLHTAAAGGHLALAKSALSEGADVSLRMKQGATPLHWAAAHGHLGVAELLVVHNADVNSVDQLGWTPIFLASANGHEEIVSLLQKHGAKLEATIQGKTVTLSVDKDWDHELLEAAEIGDFDGVKAALDGGADANCAQPDGWSALLTGATGDSRIAELLLANGADPNVASNHGYTPLMRAAGNGRVETVKLLLAAGADIEMRDCNGKTAAQLAREMRHYECADLAS